jgi:hypothetical protein
LKLEREKVTAAKLEAQATMIKVMNESSNVALAKMEEAKILQADMSSIDPLVRAWYMMYHVRIGKEVLASQAAVVPIPTAPVHEVPLMMEEAEVMREPPVTQPTQQPPAVEEPEIMEMLPLINH